jgi:hypothetical protein
MGGEPTRSCWGIIQLTNEAEGCSDMCRVEFFLLLRGKVGAEKVDYT